MHLPGFCSKLIVEVIPEEGMFRLTEPLIFYSVLLGREIIVPPTFDTDFASIPRIVQNIIQVNGRHRPAAVVHDFLCKFKQLFGINQGMADKIFREAMKCLDVEFVESSIMYRMVRRYQKTKAWLKGETY
jgi:hypothetical protein